MTPPGNNRSSARSFASERELRPAERTKSYKGLEGTCRVKAAESGRINAGLTWRLSVKTEKEKCAGRLLSGGGGEYRPAPARPTGTAASAGKTGMRFNGSACLHKIADEWRNPHSIAGEFDDAEIKQ